MKIGTVPVRRLWKQRRWPKEELEYAGKGALIGALSVAPLAIQTKNGFDTTSGTIIPILVSMGAFAYAQWGDREYLLWKPEPKTPLKVERPALSEDIKQIQEVFNEWKLGATATRLVTTGKTVSIVYLKMQKGKSLPNELGADFSRDLELPRGLQVAMEANVGDGMAAMYLPKTVRETVTQKDVYSHVKNHYEFCPGEAAEGDYPVYNALKIVHLLWAGESGGGKSVAMNSVLLQLLSITPPHLLQLVLLDYKGTELVQYLKTPHVTKPLYSTPFECYKALCDVRNLVVERSAILKAVGMRDLKEYNKAYPDTAMPLLIVVIDELVPLMLDEEYGKMIADEMSSTMNVCRACGVRFYAGTQRIGADTLPGLIRDAFMHWIGLRVKSASSSRIISGDANCAKLIGNGDQLVGIDPSERRRVQGAFVDSEAIDIMIERIVERWT